MKKRGLTLIEVLITCSLVVVYINGIFLLSSFFNRAKVQLDSNNIAMYSLESARNIILKDIRNGKKITDINADDYKNIFKKFPYPVKLELDYSEKYKSNILVIIMKCPVTLSQTKKVYYREIVINE